MSRRALRTLVVVLVGLGALGACLRERTGTAPSPDGLSTATGLPTSPAADRPTAPPSSPAPATPAVDQASGGVEGALGLGDKAKGGRLGALYDLVGLRTGDHDGFSRVVWEIEPHDKAVRDAPLWEAEQAENAGLGAEADALRGEAHIRLRLADTYAMRFVGALSIPQPANPLVRGVRLLPVGDDSSLTFAIDLAEPAPFKVSVLEAPLRIVIDVYRP